MNTNLYRLRKDAGLCVACGGTPEPGKIRCAKCFEKSAALYKKYLVAFTSFQEAIAAGAVDKEDA